MLSRRFTLTCAIMLTLALIACARDTAPPRETPTPPPVSSATPAPALTTAAPGATAPASRETCPPAFPIKANDSAAGGSLYYIPGSAAYADALPMLCFATAEDAQAAGYRRRVP